MVDWSEYKRAARDRGSLALELFVVISEPTGDPDKVRAALPEHLAYQHEQEKERRLAFAGPMSDLSGENMEGTGLIVYRARDLEEARAIAEKDPMHQSGARAFTVRRWLVNEGSLTLNIGLSTGRVGME